MSMIEFNNKNIKVAMYQTENPDNLGSAIRLCACFNIPLIIIEPCGFFLRESFYKHKSLDYKTTIITEPSWTSFCRNYKDNRIVLFTPHTQLIMSTSIIQNGDILLFGRESVGVPTSVASQCDMMLKLNIHPRTRSLNLTTSIAMTLGIVFH